MENTFDLAIVGFGPRGLFAVEQYIEKLAVLQTPRLPKIVIFEQDNLWGTGKAWDVNQTNVNWINIADRALSSFPSRKPFSLQYIDFPLFPDYLSWLAQTMNHKVSDVKDTFHPRKVMGSYLSQRAHSLLERLQSLELIQCVEERVVTINSSGPFFEIKTTAQGTYRSSKTLLTIGHLKTKISSQNKEFATHAAETDAHFSTHSYSKEAKRIYSKAKSLAIKGLGLSMIDIVRMVTQHYKGNFENQNGSIFLNYKSKEVHPIMVPFSLDGLPSVPKPLGKHIDDQFAIDKKRQTTLIKKLKHDVAAEKSIEIDQILQPIAREIGVIYLEQNKLFDQGKISIDFLTTLIVNWLKDPSTASPHFLDPNLPITDYITDTCKMAMGESPASLDYTIGQTWRQLQTYLYDIYSFKIAPATMAQLIKVDEQTKRYSYGPPVESMLQILALENAGILNLKYVSDPEIELVEEGFQLKNDNSKITATAMIDAIIPAANLEEIDDPLVEHLVRNNLAEQVCENLGIRVDLDHTHLIDGKRIEGLYSMGRIIKGNIIGVDAILECFNEEKVKLWLDQILDH